MKWRWRWNRQRSYIFVLCATLFFLSKYISNEKGRIDEEDEELSPVDLQEEEKKIECEPPGAIDSKCIADNGKPMRCWKDEEDVYFPASFLKKRFDMTGKVGKDGSTFELFTSYAKMRTPETNYDPLGAFGHFSTYSVETRDRVRCISAKTNVPMSTQWDTVPYYYPIQIAQYGLQHYSRLKIENSTRNKSEDDSKNGVILGVKSNEWKGAAGMHETTERLFFNDEEKGKVVNISAGYALANAGAYVYLDKSQNLHVVSFDWKPFDGNASFTVLAKMKQDDLLVLINYVFSEGNGKCVWQEEEKSYDEDIIVQKPRKDGQVSYSYSYVGNAPFGEWSTVTRDVLVDVARALSSGENRKKDDNVVLHPGDLRLVSLGFRGQLTVKQQINQREEQHLHAFRSAADWLVTNQDEKGGWAVPVERSIADRKLVLSPGWHSAMAQGHGISLLTRAYEHLHDVKYLFSAIKALELFKVNSSEGGVRAEFFGNVWYEEYPTTPGSFVLNGFLYSLIGLYDLSKLDVTQNEKSKIQEATDLYSAGIQSLKRLLPLYDTGSGTIYDLRHVFLGSAPNLARWDYHAVHVYLLKWIAGIEKDDFLSKTADRWIGYAYGKRAKHN
uniref:heparosan-N-sulfate-glucuronate 5-epimerase n=1 Tax=Caenorhabditis tropicalis TaxID=1561998 RepID=A0A1I7V365_9PELO